MEPIIKSKKNVLLIAPFNAPFIDTDMSILSKMASVKMLIANGFGAFWGLLRYLPYKDLIYCWFGSVYTAVAIVLAKIFGKPVIVIIGGVDAAAERGFDYGIWLSSWKAKLLTITLPLADKIWVVAPSLKEKLMVLANYSGKNIEYVPTGYDTDYWKAYGQKENLVLSVGTCDTEKRFKKKGFDLLLEIARDLPDIPFVIIGIEKALLKTLGVSVPGNVNMIEKLGKNDLREWYRKCKVFCQPSRSEGMPNTLCEAMSCECVPVGTDIDGIPVAIGEAGFIAPLGETEKLVQAIHAAMQDDGDLAQKARQRIVENFPLKRRINSLQKLIGLKVI